MDLYFSPLAGSLAARIAIYQAGAEVRFIEVRPKTKRTSDGTNFAAIHPLGYSPCYALMTVRCWARTPRFSNISPIEPQIEPGP